MAGGAVLTLFYFPAPLGLLLVHWYDSRSRARCWVFCAKQAFLSARHDGAHGAESHQLRDIQRTKHPAAGPGPRRSLPSAGGKYNPIVFPAACTWEKHFARSERRFVRHGRTTGSQKVP